MRRLATVVHAHDRLAFAGLRLLLEESDHVKLVAEAAGADHVLGLARAFCAEAAVFCRNEAGVHEARLVTEADGEGILTAVVLNRWHGADLARLIRAGACALVASHRPDRLTEAMRCLADGRTYLAPELTGALMDHLSGKERHVAAEFGLTPQEVRVLTLFAEGSSVREIESRLRISERTVRYHTANIYRKLDVKDRGAAIATAFRNGLVR